MASDLIVIAEVCLGELQRHEAGRRAGKSELGRYVDGTSDDVSDPLSTEAVDDERRPTTNQQQQVFLRAV